jgi:hypothetical protein
MSLLPYTDFDTMMDPFDPFTSSLTPFEPLRTIDPFFNRFNVAPRSMRRNMRRMDRELGKLISSVKEDDKSFQVI